MDDPRNNISINISCNGEQHTVRARVHEYRSLMHLIQDKIYIDDFGECLGMGKCATCLIEITNYVGNKICNFDRNEKETLKKAGVTDDNKRLSCQIIVDENINGIELKI